jgi:hypothetical protein
MCYVGDFSSLPDHLVSDSIPQRNPDHSYFHNSLSDLELVDQPCRECVIIFIYKVFSCHCWKTYTFKETWHLITHYLLFVETFIFLLRWSVLRLSQLAIRYTNLIIRGGARWPCGQSGVRSRKLSNVRNGQS